MGKSILLLCIVFALLIVPTVLAISTDLKESYNAEETVVIQISGNILENIEKTRVDFRRGHVSVPLEFDIKNIEGKYYLWFIAPKNENNYSLILENVVTTVDGKVEEIDFIQNFSVSGNGVDYNINPGFIVAKEDFSISLFSFADNDIEVPISYLEENTALINPGKNELKFSIKNAVGKQLFDIKIGNYVIPALIFGEEESAKAKENLPNLRFRPRLIQSTILSGTKGEVYPFEILSEQEGIITFEFDYNENIFLISPLKNLEIRNGKIIEFNITLKNPPREDIREIIYARYGNKFIALPVNINITKSEESVVTPYLESDFNEISLYYCSELKGLQCSAGETCNGDLEQSLDGSCCVGVCEEEDSAFNWETAVGWTLAIVVIVIIVFVFVKYRKTKFSGEKDFSNRVKSAEDKVKRKVP